MVERAHSSYQRLRRAWLVAAVAGLAACAAAPTRTPARAGDEQLDCRDRVMGYVVEGGFGAHRSGVVVTCEGGAATIALMRQATAESEESIRREAMSSGAFEELWEKIDSTGWRNLESCRHRARDIDPKYVITVGDHRVQKSIKCAAEASGLGTPTLEFPNDRIVGELDRAAGAYGR